MPPYHFGGNMTFYAKNFVYDGIPASEYGLKISSSSDDEFSNSGAGVELITQEIHRKPKSYLLGVKETPSLEIPIKINVEKELTAGESSAVSRWLFGQNNYKKLQIVQPDMENIYFNCVFTSPSVLRVGNIIRGYSATIKCDSPFAWAYEEREYFSSPHYYSYENMFINNKSDSSDYYYPILEIKTNVFGGKIELENKSDNSRIFGMSKLEPEDTIIVDNNLQKAYSLKTNKNLIENMKDYNYKWFRYVQNNNNILLKGSVSSITFVHNFPKKYA